MPKPTLGRIVHAYVDPATNNGSRICPAVITRVWGDDMVNLRLFQDSHATPESKTQVKLFADEQAARDFIAGNEAVSLAVSPNVAFWPPVVR